MIAGLDTVLSAIESYFRHPSFLRVHQMAYMKSLSRGICPHRDAAGDCEKIGKPEHCRHLGTWIENDSDPRHFVCFDRSEEHTSELQSLMRISYAVFCLKKKNNINTATTHT